MLTQDSFFSRNCHPDNKEESVLCDFSDALPTAILQTLVVKTQVNLVLTRLVAKFDFAQHDI